MNSRALQELMSDDQLAQFEEAFKKEIEGIQTIDELKEIYAREIARRDQILNQLQEQNQVLLKSAFKNKKDDMKE